MVRRLLVIVLLSFGAFELGAQNFPQNQWHLGEIHLINDTYVRGKVKYDLEHDVIQLDKDGRIETFSAKQVISFSLTAAPRKLRGKVEGRTERYFFSFPYTNKVGHKRPRFFEVIVEGKATLLAREYIATVTNNAGQRWGRARNARFGGIQGRSRIPTNNTRRVMAHKMFLASLDGTIRELPNKRKDILYMFRDHQSDMKAFMKDERLRTDRLIDMARFFTHCNGLCNQQRRID